MLIMKIVRTLVLNVASLNDSRSEISIANTPMEVNNSYSGLPDSGGSNKSSPQCSTVGNKIKSLPLQSTRSEISLVDISEMPIEEYPLDISSIATESSYEDTS